MARIRVPQPTTRTRRSENRPPDVPPNTPMDHDSPAGRTEGQRRAVAISSTSLRKRLTTPDDVANENADALDGVSSHTITSSRSHSHSRTPEPDIERVPYTSRWNSPDAIYNCLDDILFQRKAFIGHPDAIKNVSIKVDRNGHEAFMKGGETFQPLLFGEMAPYDAGTRISARGDKFPPTAKV